MAEWIAQLQELDFQPDQRSEVSFMPQEKEFVIDGAPRRGGHDDVEGGHGAY